MRCDDRAELLLPRRSPAFGGSGTERRPRRRQPGRNDQPSWKHLYRQHDWIPGVDDGMRLFGRGSGAAAGPPDLRTALLRGSATPGCPRLPGTDGLARGTPADLRTARCEGTPVFLQTGTAALGAANPRAADRQRARGRLGTPTSGRHCPPPAGKRAQRSAWITHPRGKPVSAHGQKPHGYGMISQPPLVQDATGSPEQAPPRKAISKLSSASSSNQLSPDQLTFSS